ncbi:hypothetical protein M441DRAFT_84979 [Trichoderma asperellum CBS 433.97]|uniref:DUF6606 domain-containing protein n=1 Tax=Trichoderma asperellum (strain ATCC 204424 / CBS 433.97 / NBRC 101777) TaxID=1042311 RepID=A0A2T3YQV9_TRIA4|nr:hypothetical protein M441DRAFT_84979 [Trichoderma asperellum CBS 433.97]PTB34948.1 hypothetical protein M441DRAFT_84979 [Trichoderma asperellum CBS 433.97]
MAISGRLKGSFSPSSIAVSLEVFREEQYQEGLAKTIATMSHQDVSEMKPKIIKAGDQRSTRDAMLKYISIIFLSSE